MGNGTQAGEKRIILKIIWTTEENLERLHQGKKEKKNIKAKIIYSDSVTISI